MRAYDIIHKKRDGKQLSQQEIQWFIQGYVNEEIPDYQMSALLMAIYFQGLNEEETLALTLTVAHSGDCIDLSSIDGVKVDKHSTGGVGDKTTLVVAPIVASCGVPVAKMSGRGLGHTGGTVDKLESIPNFQTTLSRERFFEIVNKVGICVVGQSANLAPADKKMYALRDVTATVDSIPLIAASIMSKKLAAGADAIVLDVKRGSGAFMKTTEDAIALAQTMVGIGEKANKKTVALITDMNHPLGSAIGNSLEVIEAIETLKGVGPEDLTELSVTLATHMLQLAGKGDYVTCNSMATESIKSGSALNTLKNMIVQQGGDVACVDDYSRFPQAKVLHTVVATVEGFLTGINTEQCGIASVILGAGRETKESSIDYGAGILIKVRLGDYVHVGDKIAELFTNNPAAVQLAEAMVIQALSFGESKPKSNPLILAVVGGKQGKLPKE